jgi:IS1 family transposase
VPAKWFAEGEQPELNPENFGLQASLRFPTSPPPEHVLFINAVVAKAKRVNIVRYQNSATIRKNTAAILAQEKIKNDVIHLANLQQNYDIIMGRVEHFTTLLQIEYTFTGTFDQITEQLKNKKNMHFIRKKILRRHQRERKKAFNALNKFKHKMNVSALSIEWKTYKKLYNENEKIEKKESAISANKRICSKKLMRLPHEILRYIQEYFTYDTKIALMQTIYKPLRLLNNLRSYALLCFLKYICIQPAFFAMLTDSEKENHLWTGYDNPNYNPVFENIPGAINIKRQIISTIQLYKIVYPKEAYHLMRNLCFNIDSKKKYNGRYINARLTIIPV